MNTENENKDFNTTIGNIVLGEVYWTFNIAYFPVQVFAKIFETDKDVKEYLNEGFITIDNTFINIEDMLTYKPECMPFGVVQLAFKHHFDVFGLIEKGLAIRYDK